MELWQRILMMLWLIVSARAGLYAQSGDAAQIAKQYGADHFSDIDSLEFTFHVTRGTTTIERKWRWDIRRNEVSLETVGRKGLFNYHYNRNAVTKANEPLNRVVENWFQYDQYWLLFPIHLELDKTAQITEDGWQTSLLGLGLAKRLTIRYSKGAALGPADTYQIYYGQDNRVTEWAYQSVGSKLIVATTWEKYVQEGPLLMSLEHRDKMGKFRVWFTDIKVKPRKHW